MSYIGKGMVIYCDGGNYKGNPGPYGYGIHWYTYTNEEPNSQFPLKNYIPTPLGYVSSGDQSKGSLVAKSLDTFIHAIKDDKSYHPVNVTECGEIAKGYPVIGTNNQGELNGLLRALHLVLEKRCDLTIIYSDSMYCIDGLRYLANWKKNNFITSTGKPVANKELWLLIDEVYNKILTERLNLIVKWINGHGGSDKRSDSKLSNIHADRLAKMGSGMSNSLVSGIPLENEGLHEKLIFSIDGDVTTETLETMDDAKPKKAKKKDIPKPHPFLLNKHMYLGNGGRTDKHTFFLGNPGYQINDIYIGKLIADAQLSIVRLKERDMVIEKIEEIQERWLNQHYGYNNLMYTLLMNNITLSTVYSNIAEEAESYLAASSGVPNLDTIDAKPITYVNDPVFLAAQNLGHLAELDGTLNGFLAGLSDTRVTDITDVFYDTTEMVVEETLQGEKDVKGCVGKLLKKELGNDFKKVSLPTTFGGTPDCLTEKTKDITLTANVDIPRRNVFKGVEGEFPQVKLLSWFCGGAVYRYAIVIVTHEKTKDGKLAVKDYGIWRGATASQVLILESN